MKLFDFASFLFGVAFGVLITTITLNNPKSVKTQSLNLLSQCEAPLPRNQHCKLIAVPVPPAEAPENVKVE